MGPQTNKHLPQSPFTRHFALLSTSLIFLLVYVSVIGLSLPGVKVMWTPGSPEFQLLCLIPYTKRELCLLSKTVFALKCIIKLYISYL
jgi:hypothetical protein